MMLTRYQARRDLFNSVLDEPLLLDTILQHVSIEDAINLKLSGYSTDQNSRFHETIDMYLIKQRDTKQKEFTKTMSCFVKLIDDSSFEEKVRLLNNMYDFLVDNLWYRDHFKELDRVVEKKLIEFAKHQGYSHNALYYLSELYGIHVQAMYVEDVDDDDPFVEFITDTQGGVHYL